MDMSESQQEVSNTKAPPPFLSDLKKASPRVSTSSSARFGTLSHHSFFSRHNPHPHRVRHISGLNGSPVCIVNDDWYNSTPLFPHPLIRGHVTGAGPSPSPTSSSMLYPSTFTHTDGVKSGAALISEAWREELKDLATKVSLSAASQSKRAEDQVREEEPLRRKTQYSSETGRLVPPTSWKTKRRDTAHTRPGTHTSHRHPGTTKLEGQEIRVLEMLCQILQTDSLSLVQQWLLLAGDREKELVLGMLQQAMCDASALLQQSEFPVSTQTLQTRRKRRIRSVVSAGEREKEKPVKEKPELIGDAEVLRLQQDESENIKESAGQREHSR